MNMLISPLKRVRRMFFVVFFALIFSPVYPWGATGHRIIGEIAESGLTDTAKERINAILGNVSIAMISTWGDDVRSDPAYDFTSTWHYSNIDSGVTRIAFDTLALRLNSGQNVHSVIALAEYLRQVPNDAAMLKMFIHVVQDMHCPMHLGRPGDKGGNTKHVTWFRSSTNLHSLWDSALIDSQKLSYTEYANHLMRIYPLRRIAFDGNTNTILDWAWDVYNCTQDVYASASEANKSYEYIYRYKPLWESSLAKSAEHLAILLNFIYQ